MSQRRSDADALAREKLAAAGLPSDQPLEVLERLAPRWGEQPELEVLAVSLAAGLDDPTVGEKLDALERKTESRAVRREIKRALYRLAQRGRWKPAALVPPSTSELLGTTEAEPEGRLSAFDARGNRLLWLTRRTATGVASLVAITDEEAGLRELRAAETTRKALRELGREISEDAGIELVEAPWTHVHELVREALERTSDRTRFADAAAALHAVAPSPPTTPPAQPVDAYVDRAAAARDTAALTASVELFHEPEVGSWLLPVGWLEPALGEIGDAQDSLVLASSAAHEERLRAALDRAAESIFEDGGRRERFAMRLDETAYLLAKRGATEGARQAVAAAEAVRAGRPIDEIPILADLARRSLALALEVRSKRQTEEQRSSLVVTPAQALAEQQRARSRHR